MFVGGKETSFYLGGKESEKEQGQEKSLNKKIKKIYQQLQSGSNDDDGLWKKLKISSLFFLILYHAVWLVRCAP